MGRETDAQWIRARLEDATRAQLERGIGVTPDLLSPKLVERFRPVAASRPSVPVPAPP